MAEKKATEGRSGTVRIQWYRSAIATPGEAQDYRAQPRADQAQPGRRAPGHARHSRDGREGAAPVADRE